MASFVEEKVSPFVALYREKFPQSTFETKSKRMMKDELIKFFEEETVKEEIEKINSKIRVSPELKPFDKKD